MFKMIFALLTTGVLLAAEPQSCPMLTGRVVKKGEPSYDKARLVSNYYTSKDKFPDLIVYARNPQDVQTAVQWARCKKLPCVCAAVDITTKDIRPAVALF